MKTFRIFVVMMAICMLMTGCGKHTNPSTSANPSNPTVIADTNTQEPTSQDVNSTTEATSQGNTNSGDYVSSDSRITPVRLEDYWISDTQFDLINYCRDQGATIKYRIYADDSHDSYTYCLPEELAASGQEPLAACMFFSFGVPHEFIQMECSLGYGDSFTIITETRDVLCLGPNETDEDYVNIVIDDYGTTMSLATIRHLPTMFEHVMILPYNTTPENVTNTFNTYYGES